MKKLLYLVIVLILAIPVLAGENSANKTDKAAAEKVFQQVGNTLLDWDDSSITKDRLKQFQGNLADKIKIVLVHPRLIKGKTTVTYERHTLSFSTIKNIIVEKNANIGKLGALQEGSSTRNFSIWLSWDFLRDGSTFDRANRLSIGTWEWKGSYQYPGVNHPKLRNGITLTKINGKWKLTEIQIAKVADIGD